MKALLAFGLVAGLFLIGLGGGAAGYDTVFGIVVPCLAILLFLGGFAYRVLKWASVPVPFRIPTTCGQERSLPWIRQQKLENPSSLPSVLGRMTLEILFFRSLLRNTKTRLTAEPRLVYGTDLSLWLGAIAMHWSLAIVLIRHLRLMTDPVPSFVTFVERVDGFLEVGMPVFYVTSVVFLLALGYLLYRRLVHPQVRYISLAGGTWRRRTSPASRRWS